MNSRTNQIGFSQRVRLEWLETTANLVLAGNGRAAVNEALQELLKDKVSVGGEAGRGNREKIISILMKVWHNIPPELAALQTGGLELLKRLPGTDRVAVHWGMVMAVYPFWAVVAGHTGRFLNLQGTAAAAHIQQRMREQYGERETVSRAVQRVLRSYIDWSVLGETGVKGVYRQGLSVRIDDPQLAAWLVEASLHARSNGCAPLKELAGSTSLFPFRLKEAAAENLLAGSPRLDFLRHGLDDALVMLRVGKTQVSHLYEHQSQRNR